MCFGERWWCGCGGTLRGAGKFRNSCHTDGNGVPTAYFTCRIGCACIRASAGLMRGCVRRACGAGVGGEWEGSGRGVAGEWEVSGRRVGEE